MLVDYEFYKEIFKGKLSEEEFDKFVNLSCMKITKETCSRVTNNTLNNFPNELILDIKTCACALIDKLKIFQDAIDTASNFKQEKEDELSHWEVLGY